MQPPFDIFKADGNGVVWIEAAPDLLTAKELVRAIGESLPGQYLVLDRATGNKTSIEVDSQGKDISRPIVSLPPA